MSKKGALGCVTNLSLPYHFFIAINERTACLGWAEVMLAYLRYRRYFSSSTSQKTFLHIGYFLWPDMALNNFHLVRLSNTDDRLPGNAI